MGKKRVATKEDLESRSAEDSGVVKSPKGKKSKIQRLVSCRLYIAASYNNTSLTLTDAKGNVVTWCTSGSLGFKGPKKATPFAASRVVETLLDKVRGIDLENVSIFVRGVGSGRDSALRALAGKGIDIRSIHDITPIPHNGCRPRKARRV